METILYKKLNYYKSEYNILYNTDSYNFKRETKIVDMTNNKIKSSVDVEVWSYKDCVHFFIFNDCTTKCISKIQRKIFS